MSNRLKWKLGRPGKGLYTRNGDVHTWPLDVMDGPQHAEYVDLHNLDRQAPSFNFAIKPDGYVHDNDIGFDNRTKLPDQHVLGQILQADPNLHRNKSPEDDWELDEQMPGVGGEDAAGPDYNFVLGTTMWDQMMNPGVPCPRCGSNETVLQGEDDIRCSRCRYRFKPPNLLTMADPSMGKNYDSDYFFHSKTKKPFHLSQRTGLPCYCKYGSPDRRMSRTAGAEWNRFKKQVGKKFTQLPGAERYVQAMEEQLQHDPNGWKDLLVPFLNKEFKAGRITLLDSGPPQLIANGGYIGAQLPAWGQWAAARQHPTRRGVNITSPDFTVDDIRLRSDEFQKDLADKERLEEYQERCQDAGRTVHEWPDRWHVKNITNRDDMELEGEVMNHCIGNEGEYPFNGYSYTDAADNGDINVYSLRDPQGMPHATFHTNAGSGTLAEIHGQSNHALKPEYNDRVKDYLDQNGTPYSGQAGGPVSGYGNEFTDPNEEYEEENPYSNWYSVRAPETVDQYKAIHENNDLDGMVDDEYHDACRWCYDHDQEEPELEYDTPDWPRIGEDLINEISTWGLDPDDFLQLVSQQSGARGLSDLWVAVQQARKAEEPWQPDEPSMQPDVPEGDAPEEHGQLFDPHSIQDTDDWNEWNENRENLDEAFKSWQSEDGSFMEPYTRNRKMREEFGRQYPHGTDPATNKLFQQSPYRDEGIKYPLWGVLDELEAPRYMTEQQMDQRKKTMAYDKMMELADQGQTHEQIRAQFPTLGTGQTDTPEELAWMNFQSRPDAALQGQVGQPQPVGPMTSAQLREGDTFTMPDYGHGRTYTVVPRVDGSMWGESTDGQRSLRLNGTERVIQTGAAYRPREERRPAGQPQPAGQQVDQQEFNRLYPPVQASADSDYASELVAWLHDIQPEEPVAPTPHHQSPQDMAPEPPTAANAPPYWPPGHVPDWADPTAEGRTSAEEALIERALTPSEYDALLEPRKERGLWLKRLMRPRRRFP